MPPHMMRSTAQVRPRDSKQLMVSASSAGDTTILALAADEQAYVYYLVISNGGSATNLISFKIDSGSTFNGMYLPGPSVALQNMVQAELLLPMGSTLKVNLADVGTVVATIYYSLWKPQEAAI